MNLAVIDTKTNIVGIYAGRDCVALTQFQEGVTAEKVEALRVDPEGYLKANSIQ
jgi:hypothetical protein